MSEEYTPEQFDKLPKWAQRKIAGLEAHNDTLQKQLLEFSVNTPWKPGYGNEVVTHASSAKVCLPKLHSFSLAIGGITIRACERDNTGRVNVIIGSAGRSTVSFVPSSGNSFELVDFEVEREVISHNKAVQSLRHVFEARVTAEGVDKWSIGKEVSARYGSLFKAISARRDAAMALAGRENGEDAELLRIALETACAEFRKEAEAAGFGNALALLV
jgi:hypothetical protein